MNNDEARNVALEHAWQWFEYHAQQRLFIFRFFLLLIGAIGSAFFAAFVSKLYAISMLISLIGIFLCFVFNRLDRRVSDLIKYGESAVADEQRRLALELGTDEIQIIEKAEIHPRRYLYTYSQLFRSVFYCLGFLFFVALLFVFDQYMVNVTSLDLTPESPLNWTSEKGTE